jgi:hypothetical protein
VQNILRCVSPPSRLKRSSAILPERELSESCPSPQVEKWTVDKDY